MYAGAGGLASCCGVEGGVDGVDGVGSILSLTPIVESR